MFVVWIVKNLRRRRLTCNWVIVDWFLFGAKTVVFVVGRFVLLVRGRGWRRQLVLGIFPINLIRGKIADFYFSWILASLSLVKMLHKKGGSNSSERALRDVEMQQKVGSVEQQCPIFHFARIAWHQMSIVYSFTITRPGSGQTLQWAFEDFLI